MMDSLKSVNFHVRFRARDIIENDNIGWFAKVTMIVCLVFRVKISVDVYMFVTMFDISYLHNMGIINLPTTFIHNLRSSQHIPVYGFHLEGNHS